MKLSQLLQQREALLRRLQVANLAFVYSRLGRLAVRITGAGLRGPVRLQPADPAVERYWPVLTALEGSPSVIEEHFTDEDVLELADLVSFLTGEGWEETSFRLEDMTAIFLTPLKHQLERAGVEFDAGTPPMAGAQPRDPSRK